jgi:adenylate kinase family enzyme
MRVLVFGNSGSGKDTFAKRFSARHNLTMLDLDHVVWSKTELEQPGCQAMRRSHYENINRTITPGY